MEDFDENLFDCIFSADPVTDVPLLGVTDLPPASMYDSFDSFNDSFGMNTLKEYFSDLPPSGPIYDSTGDSHLYGYCLQNSPNGLLLDDDFNLDSFIWEERNLPSSLEDVVIDVTPLNVIPTVNDQGYICIGNDNIRNSPSETKSVISTGGGANSPRGVEQRVEMIVNKTSKLRLIEFDDISKYFYMPISEAARELKVGVTALKKRCRELGIPRWPYRKMKSLESLIHNVQELGKDVMEESTREEVERLEQQKRLMEKKPELQMTERAKRLRQACFKANYHKRRRGTQSPGICGVPYPSYLDDHRLSIL